MELVKKYFLTYKNIIVSGIRGIMTKPSRKTDIPTLAKTIITT